LIKLVNPKVVIAIKPWQKTWNSEIWVPKDTLKRPASEIESPIIKAVFNFIVKFSDIFISITDEIQEDMRFFNIPERKIFRINNGVNTAIFCPVTPSEKRSMKKYLGLPDIEIVTYVGLMKPEKGLPILLEAWAETVISQTKLHLLIVGPKQPIIEYKSLLKLVEELNIENSVTFTGCRDNISDYLKASSIFVLPSILEGFSNAVLEAMSCGLPGVFTDIPGIRTAINHGVNGLLVKPGNSEMLANAIISLLLNKDMANNLGEEARKTILEEFSVNKIVQQYINAYHSCLQQRDAL